MQFLVYIVVLLVALGGVLVELDWLTKPKLEPKAMQTASVAAPAPDAKVDGPSVELSPVYRTSPPPDEAPAPAAASAPPANAAITGSVAAETTGLGGPALRNSFTAVPARQPMASFQPAVPPQPATQAPVREAAAPANPPVAKPEPKSAALQSPNHCEVAACAGMYTSFRAADCSYQPLEGPRKLCAAPSGNAQKAASEPRDRNAEAAARKDSAKDSAKRSKEAELRAVERKVREITSRETQRAMAQEDDDADIDSALPGGRRVIIIRRGPRW